MRIISKITHVYMHIQYKLAYINKIETNYLNLIENYINKTKDVDIDLVTIAFNNPQVIETQIKLLRKNLIDNYNLVIADNSCSSEKSKKICEICRKYNIDYIRLPANPYNGKMAMGSYSNGSAMNYMYKYYISKRKTKYFGFLDHDVFPVKKVSILKNCENQEFWGVLRCMPSNKNKLCTLYLWAGFCFFNKSCINDSNKVDFRPKRNHGDTGASNYKHIYYPIIKTDEFLNYCFSEVKRVSISGLLGSPQGSQYEIISNSWLHYLNASNWMNENFEEKERKMLQIIQEYTKRC